MPQTALFSPDTLKFLHALNQNNTRDWFQQNRTWYESAWKQPAEAFISALTFRLQTQSDTLHSAKLFRIHRDVRFSKDKTPYNPHMRILIRREGSRAGLFFGLELDRLVLGSGMMAFDKPQLSAYRGAVAEPAGETLDAVLSAVISNQGRMNPPELARVPKPYDPDHPRGELLRRKSLTVWRDYDDAHRIEAPDLLELCAAQFATYRDLDTWLSAHLPATTQGRKPI